MAAFPRKDDDVPTSDDAPDGPPPTEPTPAEAVAAAPSAPAPTVSVSPPPGRAARKDPIEVLLDIAGNASMPESVRTEAKRRVDQMMRLCIAMAKNVELDLQTKNKSPATKAPPPLTKAEMRAKELREDQILRAKARAQARETLKGSKAAEPDIAKSPVDATPATEFTAHSIGKKDAKAASTPPVDKTSSISSTATATPAPTAEAAPTPAPPKAEPAPVSSSLTTVSSTSVPTPKPASASSAAASQAQWPALAKVTSFRAKPAPRRPIPAPAASTPAPAVSPMETKTASSTSASATDPPLNPNSPASSPITPPSPPRAEELKATPTARNAPTSASVALSGPRVSPAFRIDARVLTTPTISMYIPSVAAPATKARKRSRHRGRSQTPAASPNSFLRDDLIRRGRHSGSPASSTASSSSSSKPTVCTPPRRVSYSGNDRRATSSASTAPISELRTIARDGHDSDTSALSTSLASSRSSVSSSTEKDRWAFSEEDGCFDDVMKGNAAFRREFENEVIAPLNEDVVNPEMIIKKYSKDREFYDLEHLKGKRHYLGVHKGRAVLQDIADAGCDYFVVYRTHDIRVTLVADPIEHRLHVIDCFQSSHNKSGLGETSKRYVPRPSLAIIKSLRKRAAENRRNKRSTRGRKRA